MSNKVKDNLLKLPGLAMLCCFLLLLLKSAGNADRRTWGSCLSKVWHWSLDAWQERFRRGLLKQKQSSCKDLDISLLSVPQVTSASNCTDFQSYRLGITYPNPNRARHSTAPGRKYAHTVCLDQLLIACHLFIIHFSDSGQWNCLCRSQNNSDLTWTIPDWGRNPKTPLFLFWVVIVFLFDPSSL